ncbi:MAG: nucleotidyltransferase domain-containing protein [Nitrospirae bacterium]|nr:nucleotidyltransferase domain-containing protein [Nitrospirota bacterium]
MDADIEAIRTWAKSQPIVKRVWLFGSRIRGNERPDSDLDIAVEHDCLPGDSDAFTTAIFEKNNWHLQLQPLVSLIIDLQSYISGMTPIVEAGLNDSSMLIYERRDA